VRVLLDTQVWLWMLAAPDRLGVDARSLVEDGENELLLSSASSWEISIKHSLGKLPLPEPPLRYVPSRIEQSGVTPIVVEHTHALRVATLPLHHRDPFDRLLVAQALELAVPVLTADRALAAYDVEVLAAS
jgi:PIN domain nuclease of toxin-antitoxin system